VAQPRRSVLLGLSAAYTVSLLAGPVVALAQWISTFGLWGGDPLSLAAVPSWVALAIPEIIGVGVGWRVAGMDAGRRWMVLVGPAIFVGIAVILTRFGMSLTVGGEGGFVILAMVYAFGPLGLGAILHKVRDQAARDRGRDQSSE
jgi:hypothetical protein